MRAPNTDKAKASLISVPNPDQTSFSPTLISLETQPVTPLDTLRTELQQRLAEIDHQNAGYTEALAQMQRKRDALMAGRAEVVAMIERVEDLEPRWAAERVVVGG